MFIISKIRVLMQKFKERLAEKKDAKETCELTEHQKLYRTIMKFSTSFTKEIAELHKLIEQDNKALLGENKRLKTQLNREKDNGDWYDNPYAEFRY